MTCWCVFCDIPNAGEMRPYAERGDLAHAERGDLAHAEEKVAPLLTLPHAPLPQECRGTPVRYGSRYGSRTPLYPRNAGVPPCHRNTNPRFSWQPSLK